MEVLPETMSLHHPKGGSYNQPVCHHHLTAESHGIQRNHSTNALEHTFVAPEARADYQGRRAAAGKMCYRAFRTDANTLESVLPEALRSKPKMSLEAWMG